MGLTPSKELRRRLLQTLRGLPSSTTKRGDVLDAMAQRYERLWSADDLESPASRPFETKWRNNTSYERAHMVTDGLLVSGGAGAWVLTPKGQEAADAESETGIGGEYERRELLWRRLVDEHGTTEVSGAALKDLGIYSGQSGIYVNKTVTAIPAFPGGIAQTFLHIGGRYPDDLSEDGMVYHYPHTKRPGTHDSMEVNAAKAALQARLPVFRGHRKRVARCAQRLRRSC